MVANILANLKDELTTGELGELAEFDVVKFLADEFAYRFEDDNEAFDEAKFRQEIYGDNMLLCTTRGCGNPQVEDGEFCEEHI